MRGKFPARRRRPVGGSRSISSKRRRSLPLHALRHAAATLALQQGIHPKIVQDMLGHSTHTLTMNTYDLAGGSTGLISDSNYAFIYAPDGTIEQVALTNGQANYLLTDSSGSVRGIVSATTGALTASTTFDAYGNPETPAMTQGGVSYPGLTAYTPLAVVGLYADATATVTNGTNLTDPSTGVDLAPATPPRTAGAMRMFWDPRREGPDTGLPARQKPEYPGVARLGRGTIFSGGDQQKGYVNGTPCSGYFYAEGGHGGKGNPACPKCTLSGNPWDLYAIDWQAQVDTGIFAQHSGWIKFANTSAENCGTGKNGVPGLELVIKYTNGIWSWYCHLSSIPSKIQKAAGTNQQFASNTLLALSGKSGYTHGPTGTLNGKFADYVHEGMGYDMVVTPQAGITSGNPVKQASMSHPLYDGCTSSPHYYPTLAPHHPYHSCWS